MDGRFTSIVPEKAIVVIARFPRRRRSRLSNEL
jgi:hypothetical protein